MNHYEENRAYVYGLMFIRSDMYAKMVLYEAEHPNADISTLVDKIYKIDESIKYITKCWEWMAKKELHLQRLQLENDKLLAELIHYKNNLTHNQIIKPNT